MKTVSISQGTRVVGEVNGCLLRKMDGPVTIQLSGFDPEQLRRVTNLVVEEMERKK